MANLDGVKISKGELGVNSIVGGDEISGIIIQIPDAISGINYEKVEACYNIKDVQKIGLTEEFDKTNKVNAYRHCLEFYRMAKVGTKLNIMLVSNTKDIITDVIEDSSEGEDDSLVKQMIIDSKGDIRQLAVALNPKDTPTLVDGINSEVKSLIPKLQSLAEWSYDNHMPLHTLLEGRDYGGTASSVMNLRDIPNIKATKVSVVIGQDYNYANTLEDEIQKTFADVGTCLGTVSKARVEQNIGNNEEFDITDATKGAWEVAGLSNNQKISEQYSDLQTLENKGYIFGITYIGLDGVRWNSDHTCVEVVADANDNLNESNIAYSRVIDKSVRLLRSMYLRKIKTNQPVDAKTGKLPAGVVSYFNSLGDIVFDGMVARGEITSGKTIVDKNSDLLKGDKTLKITYKIVPVGTVGEIEGSINLKSKID